MCYSPIFPLEPKAVSSSYTLPQSPGHFLLGIPWPNREKRVQDSGERFIRLRGIGLGQESDDCLVSP